MKQYFSHIISVLDQQPQSSPIEIECRPSALLIVQVIDQLIPVNDRDRHAHYRGGMGELDDYHSSAGG
uniref:Uncharacterized protein n=1 Tax=Anopheles albimanus TaxID=7167 RepID=A0A182FC63_ANOAL